MTKLDDQLKELKLKKQRTQFLKIIKNRVESAKSTKCSAVSKEVKKLVNDFIDSKIKEIESGSIVETASVEGLEQKHIAVLKVLAEKASQFQSQTLKKAPEKPIDPIKFSLQFKNCYQQSMRLRKTGEVGVVNGIEAPYLCLKLENGKQVKVKPENLILMNRSNHGKEAKKPI